MGSEVSAMSRKVTQRWSLIVHGQSHRVEVEGSVMRTTRWYIDDDLVATKRSGKGNVVLGSASLTGCAIELELGVLRSAWRATLFEGEDHAVVKELVATGTEGVDLEPEQGSPAARREQHIREHPWRHTTIAAAVGVMRVVAPLVMGLLVVRFALTLPWPQWSVPWPHLDMPRIPLPDIPWSGVHLPNWEPPQWARWVTRTMRYGWPVLLALLVARVEIDRRREQDARRAELKRGLDQAPAPTRTSPRPHQTTSRDDGTGCRRTPSPRRDVTQDGPFPMASGSRPGPSAPRHVSAPAQRNLRQGRPRGGALSRSRRRRGPGTAFLHRLVGPRG